MPFPTGNGGAMEYSDLGEKFLTCRRTGFFLTSGITRFVLNPYDHANFINQGRFKLPLIIM